jgi:arylsulfatase A-like enzyme
VAAPEAAACCSAARNSLARSPCSPLSPRAASALSSSRDQSSRTRGHEVTGYRGWTFKTDAGQVEADKGVGLTPDISRHLADAAIDFVRIRPEKPFFLHVNFTALHDPRLWPPGYESKYDPAKLPLPPSFRSGRSKPSG